MPAGSVLCGTACAVASSRRALPRHMPHAGAFGCHVALVLRRLRRLCARVYSSSPTFAVTTATLANPAEHAAALLGVDSVQGEGWRLCSAAALRHAAQCRDLLSYFGLGCRSCGAGLLRASPAAAPALVARSRPPPGCLGDAASLPPPLPSPALVQ